MVRIRLKDKSNLIIPSLLGTLVLFAILDSLMLYSLQVQQETQIIDLSKQELIDRLSRESFQLSQIAALQLERIKHTTDILTIEPAIREHEDYIVPLLLQSTQSTTSHITDSYFIFDKDGILIYATDNQNDLSFREFSQNQISADLKSKVYTSNSMESPDLHREIYVTSPIINQETGEFDGVIGAALPVDLFVQHISSNLALGGESHVELTDKDGKLMYSSRVPELVGKSIVSEEYVKSHIQDFDREHYISSIDKATSGWTGFFELNDRDENKLTDGTLVAYSPILIDNEIILLNFVSSPASVNSIITEALVAERSYAVGVVYSILAVLGFFAVVIIIINKKLRKLVNIRTRELEKANEELELKDRLKDQFISIASHELRSPIQPILGFANLAKKRKIDEDEAWSGVLRHSRKLQKLAHDILDVSRIESGYLTYIMEKFRINNVILDTIDAAKLNLNSHTSIESKLDRDVEIEADKDRITQALSNIIGNAVKFTKKGTIVVESHLFPEKKKIEIKISDTGSGIPNDILPNLFGKFVTKSVDEGNQQGTGLGLFISKAIVTAHKGEIFAYNNGEGGATFTILLPILNNSKSMKILGHGRE
ncbi:MAG: ATP-binding protein [Nitrososphaerales archaeon]